jgi:tetratricopeptide (TPR) repeat protein
MQPIFEKPDAPMADVQDDNQAVEQPLEAVDNLAALAARMASPENINAKNHDPEEVKQAFEKAKAVKQAYLDKLEAKQLDLDNAEQALNQAYEYGLAPHDLVKAKTDALKAWNKAFKEWQQVFEDPNQVLQAVISDEAYGEGVKAYNAGKYEEAVKHYTKAIELSPKPKFVYHANRPLASCRRETRQTIATEYSEYYRMALEDANICVRMDATSPRGYVLRAAVWRRQGYLFSAKEALEKVLELDENDSIATRNLQEIREQIRRQGKAYGHSGESLEKMVTKERILSRDGVSP